MKSLCIVPLALFILLFPAFKDSGMNKGPLTISTVTGPSQNKYTFIYKNNAQADFVVVRPEKKDTAIWLCIPAAFTQLTDYTIDGIYMANGKTGNEKSINHSLGGAICITKGEVAIFPTAKGKFLTDSLINAMKEQKSSFFQQIQMIENGIAATFKDQKLFQRRGIAVMKNGRTAVVESRNAITLKTFADDLAALGAKDLLYTDMGAWDEGWYRDVSGNTVSMGYDHSQTDKQSNWFVFRK
jgi:hypothetical protein